MNIYTGPAAPATDSAAPQAQSWRDSLPIHPAAALFPRMSSDELRELGKDIRKNGLRSSIALWQSDKGASALLLDGISRLDAVEVELGRPVRVVPRTYRRRTRWFLETDEDGKSVPVTNLIGEAGNTTAEEQTFILLGRDVDPWAYVTSANLHRRHLTAEQRRELIGKLIEAMPEKSNRQIAKLVNASPTTVGTKRAEMEATGDVSKLDTSTDTRGRRQPVHKARATALKARLSERAVAVKSGVAILATEVTAAPSSSATVAARDDIGPDSAGEIARLNARIDELQAEKRQLEIKVVGLRSEIDELKAAAARPTIAAVCDHIASDDETARKLTRLNRFEIEVTQLRGERSALKSEVKELKAEVARLTRENDALRAGGSKPDAAAEVPELSACSEQGARP